ncbi:hypothetical protein ES708_29214 [subsurface metagenome]
MSLGEGNHLGSLGEVYPLQFLRPALGADNTRWKGDMPALLALGRGKPSLSEIIVKLIEPIKFLAFQWPHIHFRNISAIQSWSPYYFCLL